MPNKKCGTKTERFINEYRPEIDSIMCAFADVDTRRKFEATMDKQKFMVTTSPSKPLSLNYVIIEPNYRTKLTFPLLHEFINHVSKFPRIKLYPDAPNNYCEIGLIVKSIINHTDMVGLTISAPLQCPYFERAISANIVKLRKKRAKQAKK